MKKSIFCFCFILATFVPFTAQAAASLYINPAGGTYREGDLFSVLVSVDSSGGSINAGSGELRFDNSRLQVTGLGFSKSIFSIWTEEPRFSNATGLISFSGGIPNPGFNGSGGALVRITFKALREGSAETIFLSGSVLANDGLGTNVANDLIGGSYTILKKETGGDASPVRPQTVSTTTSETHKPVETPIITHYPDKLHRGDVMTLKGLGIPLSRLSLSVQRGSEDPEYYDAFAGTDGRFAFTYELPVRAGFYRISARNILNDGSMSGLSEQIIVEVVDSAFIRIGVVVVSYAAIIFVLLALLFTSAFLLLFVWMRIRAWRKEQGKEISEAEVVVHRSFDVLRQGLGNYISYLVGGKSKSDIDKREKRTKQDIIDELNAVEQGIEKEIKDIKNK